MLNSQEGRIQGEEEEWTDRKTGPKSKINRRSRARDRRPRESSKHEEGRGDMIRLFIKAMDDIRNSKVTGAVTRGKYPIEKLQETGGKQCRSRGPEDSGMFLKVAEQSGTEKIWRGEALRRKGGMMPKLEPARTANGWTGQGVFGRKGKNQKKRHTKDGKRIPICSGWVI